MKRRIAIDTNVYVSRLLRPSSVSGTAVAKAWTEDITLISLATWTELQSVLNRPKFAPYIQPGSLEPYLQLVRAVAAFVDIPTPIRACRDAKDDKFLELAVHGRAEFLVTGDRDLLDLNPFCGVSILTPAAYLAFVSPQR